MHVTYFFTCVQVVSTGNVIQQEGNLDGVCLCGFLSAVVQYLSLHIQPLLLFVFTYLAHAQVYAMQLNMYSVVYMFNMDLLKTGSLSSLNVPFLVCN